MRNLIIKRNKSGQSEMIGFVVIVALVMVIAFIFLIIQIRKPTPALQSTEVENMIASVLQQTTNCAPEYVPNYDSVQDLIKDSYENKKCINLNQRSIDYLNDTLPQIMRVVKSTEASIMGYKMDIYYESKDEEAKEGILGIIQGNFSAIKTRGAQQTISTPDGKIIVKLALYYDS